MSREQSEQSEQSEHREQLEIEIREKLHKDGHLVLFNGVYGNLIEDKKHAYIEEIRETPDGVFVKLFGCSILYKGNPNKELIERLDILKRIVSGISYIPFIVPIILIKKDAFLRYFIGLYNTILGGVKTPYVNKLAKELFDKGSYVIQTEILISFCLFLEFDNAYRLRFQDIVAKFDSHKPFRREILRLFDIYISREHDLNLLHKFKQFRKIASFILLFKSIRIPLQKFLVSLDMNKVNMDVDDMYFAFGCKEYDTFGIGEKERREYIEKKDIQMGNIKLTL